MSTDRQRKILLNPGPGTTSQSVKTAQLVDDICPRESEFGNVMLDICDGLLEIGNAKPNHEVSLFAASGTGAIEATLISSISETGKVLIINNGAYGQRMLDICHNYSLNFEAIGSFGEYPLLNEVEEKLSTRKFSHLAMAHHETSTGMLNPLEEVADLCQQYDTKIIADAMSSFGAYPMDLNELKIDYLVSSSNKCIQGMAGLSFVIFSKDNLEELKTNGRAYYLDVYKQWENLQTKRQLRFTPPVQVCYAFLQAIRETLEESVKNRHKRYCSNWQVLYAGMKDLGFRFFLPLEQESKILMAIELKNSNVHFDDLHDYLYKLGITIYPGVIPECKTFRLAIIGDLKEKDMHEVVLAIQEYFSGRKILYKD